MTPMSRIVRRIYRCIPPHEHWCLYRNEHRWPYQLMSARINNEESSLADPINQRHDTLRQMRINSGKAGTNSLSMTPKKSTQPAKPNKAWASSVNRLKPLDGLNVFRTICEVINISNVHKTHLKCLVDLTLSNILSDSETL